MQEKNKYVSTVEFLTVYGPKVSSNEHYFEDDDTTDQRAPVNNPSELWDSFIMDDDIRAEIAAGLEGEDISDFDNDVYDYEDRSDLGEDIALAQSIDLSKIRPNSRSKSQLLKEKVEKATEDLEEVNKDED